MTYSQLKQQSQDKHNKLCDDCQVFWAFSNKQFDESLKKLNLNQGEKLLSIGAGGYLPKKNRDTFVNGLNEIEKWEKAERKQIKADQVIEHELSNYECYYSSDITNAYKLLKDMGYTQEQVIKVYHATKSKHNN